MTRSSRSTRSGDCEVVASDDDCAWRDADRICRSVHACLARFHLAHLLCGTDRGWRSRDGSQGLVRGRTSLELRPKLSLDVECQRVVLVLVAVNPRQLGCSALGASAIARIIAWSVDGMNVGAAEGCISMLLGPSWKVGRRSVDVVRCELARLSPCTSKDATCHGACDGDAGDNVHHAVCICVGQDVDEKCRDEEEELNGEKCGGLLNEHGLDIFGIQVVSAGREESVEKATPTGFVELADGHDEADEIEKEQRTKDADDVETVEMPGAKVGGGELSSAAHDGKEDGKGNNHEPGGNDEGDNLLVHVPDGAGSKAKDEHGCADGDAEQCGAALHPCVAMVGHDDAVGDGGDEPG